MASGCIAGKWRHKCSSRGSALVHSWPGATALSKRASPTRSVASASTGRGQSYEASTHPAGNLSLGGRCISARASLASQEPAALSTPHLRPAALHQGSDRAPGSCPGAGGRAGQPSGGQALLLLLRITPKSERTHAKNCQRGAFPNLATGTFMRNSKKIPSHGRRQAVGL